jgi:hypothetical protein
MKYLRTYLSTDMRFLESFTHNSFKIPHVNFRRVRSEMDFVDREAISEMAADYFLRERVEAWLESNELAGSPPFDVKPIPSPGWLPPEESFEDDESGGKEHPEWERAL